MHKIVNRDGEGNPTRVHIDDGFMQCARPYDSETDGWMENQLAPHDFPAIQVGRDMEYLVAEVNALRRENYRLNKILKLTDKVFFGSDEDEE